MVPRKRSFVAVGLVAVVGVAAAVGFVAIVQNPSLVQNPIVEVSTPRWRTFVTVALAGIVLFSSFYLLWRLPDLLRSRALHKRFPDSLILSGSRTDSAFGSGANTPPTSHQLSDSRPGRVIPSSYPLWFCVEINDSGFNLWHRASDELPIMSEVWGNVHAARLGLVDLYRRTSNALIFELKTDEGHTDFPLVILGAGFLGGNTPLPYKLQEMYTDYFARRANSPDTQGAALQSPAPHGG